MSHQRPGLFSRIRAAFGCALKCRILGKSMNRFSGSDEYWDRVIAAQLGWPQKQFPELEPDCFRSAGDAVQQSARPPEPESVRVRLSKLTDRPPTIGGIYGEV
jgi:hypothetical protein